MAQLLDPITVDLVWHLKENNAPVIVNIKKIPIIIFMNIDWKNHHQ